MLVLKINQIGFVVKEEISILDACKFVGIKIPRFCYHDILSIAGSCRMCLVKLELDDKLLVSCVTEVESDMEIICNDPLVQKVREEILEFLLLDHPLDCPICDQAGECDLQDQVKVFGSSFTKYTLNKSVVEDKDFGVFIKSIMTRCIHCTRCVRFSSEIAGIDFFGTLNRGNSTEIGVFLPTFFNSEISGNVIDLCPVGALTSKSYAFKARPWELKSIETIDLSDGLGSNIYTHFTDSGIARVIPKFNSEINETIISDKTRFSYDSFLSFNSLKNILEFKNSICVNSLMLDDFYKKVENIFKKQRLLIVFSDELNFETLNILKKISFINPNIKIRKTRSSFNNQTNLFVNDSNLLSSVQDALNTVFLVAVNPRTEAALLNTRLRFLSFNNYFRIYSFGLKFESTLNNFFLNLNVQSILKFIVGKSKLLSSLLVLADRPLVILGNSIIERGVNIERLISFLKKVNPSSVFLKVYLFSNTTSSLFLGFKSISLNSFIKSENVCFLKCRESIFLKKAMLSIFRLKQLFWFSNYFLNFKLNNGYQIPIKNVFEEDGVYLNLEFRPQQSKRILNNKMNLRSLLFFFKTFFSVRSVLSVHARFIKSFLKNPSLFSLNNFNYLQVVYIADFLFFCISKYPLKSQQIDFFKTNYYTDFSKNMLTASRVFQRRGSNFFI
jgi:NADH-quinone oxidoreductase chain G